VEFLYPILLEATLHTTIWGGQRLRDEGWKRVEAQEAQIGEAWETEMRSVARNGQYAGKTLGALVDELGTALLGDQVVASFGRRFPLLAKFIDAHASLSVQVHPDDEFAARHEGGKLGKTEFWYVLAAKPGATIGYGFKHATTAASVRQAIEAVAFEELLHTEEVAAGDVIFVPAGTVHAIGGGILLYELQEYSDITYRMYDYGRLTADGAPRELHIDRSLAVCRYTASPHAKASPVPLAGGASFRERCLAACRYFVAREILLGGSAGQAGVMPGTTLSSCVVLSSLEGEIVVRYGDDCALSARLARGQSMVLPAALGNYLLTGSGRLVSSYVPTPGDAAWRLWESHNSALL
jgi:mannose-6-phosphate isomerase